MKKQSLFGLVFTDNFDGLLPDIPKWVGNAISRCLASRKLVLVSAVCPDYAREEKGFTYITISDGVPYIAKHHLEIVRKILPLLQVQGVALEYYMTLADTEFDLPFVVEHMSNGDPFKFLSLCQANCDKLMLEASAMNVPLKSCMRFTQAFPKWYTAYHACLKEIISEIESNSSVRTDLEDKSYGREPLYQAMTSERITQDYCRQMVIRQWAQYMAWGRLAEPTFGKGLVMMNHNTPNLGRINHPFVRQGQERIPLLKLSLSTMPVGCE
jgi:hypothetical protein